MEKVRDHDHQEEEDVSLCDLPVLSLMKEESNSNNDKEHDAENDVVYTETQEEFAFGSVCGGVGSLSTVSEMCAADEVFFRGQILPLRLSVSSDVGPARNDPTRKLGSRSESMDHGSLGGFRSISSRSSSCSSRSTQHSSSSTATITITRVTSEPRLKSLNQFHAHPSPKPQIRVSSARLERLGSTNNATRKHKSSMWDIFRLGLVRTPDIELQEVNKVNFIRSNSRANNNNNNKGSSSSPSVSRNSSVNNNDNISNVNNLSPINNNSNGSNGDNANGAVLNAEKQKRRNFLSGCRCSVDTVAPNVIMVKSKGTVTTTNAGSTSGAKHGMTKEKVVLAQEFKTTSSLKEKNKQNNQLDQKQEKQQRQKQEGSRKQAMSHHRTYEWLKELSHANLSMHV